MPNPILSGATSGSNLRSRPRRPTTTTAKYSVLVA
jgi:hypothetical protein